MIDPLAIGAGLTLFALGAGGTWAVMRVRVAVAAAREKAAIIGLGSRTLDYLGEREISNCLNEAFREARAAHVLCADALETLRNQREEVRTICTGVKRVRAARVMEVIGD